MYDGDKVKQKHEASQKSNKFYYNRRYSSRSLPVLKKGDQVRIKTEKDDVWGKPAVVVGTTNTPRSYDVQTETGVLRRNRRHLLRIPRDEREKREIPRSTHKKENNRNPDHENPVETIPAEPIQNPDNESPVETMPAEPTRSRITGRAEGTRTRSGRLSIPPDRLHL